MPRYKYVKHESVNQICLIAHLKDYKPIRAPIKLDMFVLFHDYFILASLTTDWSMFNVIFSSDVKQNLKLERLIYF